MPSGAKKRKAAKKKLQKEVHNNDNGPQSQGNESSRSHDDRESDDGEVEREPSEEVGKGSHELGAKETNLGEAKIPELASEVNPGQNFNDANVELEVDDSSKQSQNGNASREDHKSSSSSSSEDEVVKVEKEKQQSQSSPVDTTPSVEIPKDVDYVPEATSDEILQNFEGAYNSADRTIPVEESVKEVVSLPQELNVSTVVSNMANSSDEQHNVSSAGTDLQQGYSESKVDSAVGTTEVDNEGLLPPSSVVTTVDKNGRTDDVKEKPNCPEEKPLVSSAAPPVQRTSLMNCCGLFELLSGGSNR